MKLLGWDDRYSDDGTGVSILRLFFIPVWSRSFYHSTTYLGD